MTATATDKVTSGDFIPAADRRTGLTISTYRIGPDGTRYDRTPRIDIAAEPPTDPDAYHPAKGWPICACPRCRTAEA